MKLTHSCIITNDVKKLKTFYENILQLKGEIYEDNYAEFVVGKNVLAIYSLKAHNEIAPDSAEPSSNNSIILEFDVDDVDKEYKRLIEMDVETVKAPTTQPWGNRSFYFRDPDGNLISFYKKV
ncbi:MAG: VOC family protein [Bacillota bacterium]|nr:VOC family protein [Bacillota bacterium]